ncbi:MAG: NADH:flavin oxidoreductase [Myxococcales bacterium]|nr:NADH:flavin oxidoreductase [Myxococcales bacterium]
MIYFEPTRLRGLALQSRVIKSATYEGMSPGGLPSPALIEHHRALAAGGVGLTTVAYCAVSPGGRSFAEQLLMTPATAEALRPLTAAVRAAGGEASLQLTHCGFFSKLQRPRGERPLAPSRVFNAYGALSGEPWSRAMSEAEIEVTIADFAEAAAMAQGAGFGAVELHMGHGYLLSQFLTPSVNRRRDRWGGSLEGRLRMPLAVVAATREAIGEAMPIVVKMNLRDGFRGGLEIDEAVAIARALEAAGVDLLVLSGGYTSKTPLFLLRGGRPLADMIAVEPSAAQRWALRLFGPLVVRRYPFEECFLRELALQVRAAVKMPLALLGGLVSRANLEAAAADGFEFVAMARALIADPDLVVRMRRGEIERTRCDNCNRCIALMDAGGVRCALDEPPGPLSRPRSKA